MDVVSEVVALRSAEPDGLQRMLAASVLGHGILLALVLVAPTAWFTGPPPEPEHVMTISLGGASGPRTGMTTLGGRPIQQIAPVLAKPVIEPMRPPAAREPEMIEPKKEKPKLDAAKTADTAKDPRSRTPTKGEEIRKGSTVAETFGRGQGFGLSSGGGGTGSYLDSANFCCPEYLSTMVDLIRRNWDSRQQSVGTAVVKYTIQRDGTLTGIGVEKSSGYSTLDFLAMRAMQLTRKLPPLPSAFTEPSLTVHLFFEYQR